MPDQEVKLSPEEAFKKLCLNAGIGKIDEAKQLFEAMPASLIQWNSKI